MNKFIYILNYSAFPKGAIYKIILDEKDNEEDDIQRLFDKYGLNVDECSWMFSDDDLEIVTIKPCINE